MIIILCPCESVHSKAGIVQNCWDFPSSQGQTYLTKLLMLCHPTKIVKIILEMFQSVCECKNLLPIKHKHGADAFSLQIQDFQN